MANLLEVDGLCAGYGASQVLEELTFSMEQEAVSIVGRNGMGKSTWCNTIMGLVEPSAGSIVFDGKRIDGSSPEQVARSGIAYIPQGRRLFPSLTVDEHLSMLAKGAKGKRWTPAEVYKLFPRLAERKKNGGAQLSGGEQQMCAIGRALMSRPETILLDEPSMGLAPQLVEQIFGIVKTINESEGVSFLLAEQNTNVALRFAHYGYILESGRVVMDGPAAELRENPDVKEFYMGMSDEGRKSFRDVRSYRRRKRWLS